MVDKKQCQLDSCCCFFVQCSHSHRQWGGGWTNVHLVPGFLLHLLPLVLPTFHQSMSTDNPRNVKCYNVWRCYNVWHNVMWHSLIFTKLHLLITRDFLMFHLRYHEVKICQGAWWPSNPPPFTQGDRDTVYYNLQNQDPRQSKHLKGRMVPRVSHVFWTKRIFLFSLFPDIFCVQRILLFPCFQTLSVFKEFFRFPVSGHFPYSRDLGVSLFLDILTFQKCLETGKTTKSFEKIIIVKEFCHFSCL